MQHENRAEIHPWRLKRQMLDICRRPGPFRERPWTYRRGKNPFRKAIRRFDTAMDEFLMSARLCLSGNGLFREGYGVLDEGFFTRRRGGRGLVGTQHLPLGVK